jgi:virginiamycin B lyase
MRPMTRHLPGALGMLAALLALGAAAPERPLSVREFEAPVLAFPTGIAVATDGAVWIASTFADKLVRFDPATSQLREVSLELRTHPVGVLADPGGAIWYAASGLGRVGRLDPGTSTPKEFGIPAMLTARNAIPSPWLLARDPADGNVWFTVHSDGTLGRLPRGAEPVRRGFAVTEIKLGSPELRPDGIAADGRGGIWVAEPGADRLARVSAADGTISAVALAKGSRPRGVAAAPDGSIWVTLFGSHELLRLDPLTRDVRTWPMPSGPHSSPWAIAVAGSGLVWVAEFMGDAIVRFDPGSGRMTAVALPTPRSRVRALAVDARERVWYAGSASGRLGVIE